VVPIHLAAPIILMLRDLLLGRVRPDLRFGTILALLTTAIVLIAHSDSETGSSQSVLLGGAFALLSAICVSGLIITITSSATAINPCWAATWQLSSAGLAGALLLNLGHSTPESNGVMLMVGAVFFGPAFAAYWRFSPRVGARAVATLGLAEAPYAVISSRVLFGDALTVSGLAAGALVIVAVFLDSFRTAN